DVYRRAKSAQLRGVHSPADEARPARHEDRQLGPRGRYLPSGPGGFEVRVQPPATTRFALAARVELFSGQPRIPSGRMAERAEIPHLSYPIERESRRRQYPGPAHSDHQDRGPKYDVAIYAFRRAPGKV